MCYCRERFSYYFVFRTFLVFTDRVANTHKIHCTGVAGSKVVGFSTAIQNTPNVASVLVCDSLFPLSIGFAPPSLTLRLQKDREANKLLNFLKTSQNMPINHMEGNFSLIYCHHRDVNWPNLDVLNQGRAGTATIRCYHVISYAFEFIFVNVFNFASSASDRTHPVLSWSEVESGRINDFSGHRSEQACLKRRTVFFSFLNFHIDRSDLSL